MGIHRASLVLVFGTMAAWAIAGCCSATGTGGCLRARTIRQAAAAGEVDRLRRWLNDERSWVREEAALAAGESRRVALVSAVQARLLDVGERPWVRSAAATALGDFGAEVDPTLLASTAIAPSTPPEVKAALAEAICRVQPAGGAELLAGLVNDADPLVAAVAARKAQTKCGSVR